MSSSLLKERELFRKKALSLPVVEKRKTNEAAAQDDQNRKKAKFSSNSSNTDVAKKTDLRSYKTMAGCSEYRFSVLTKIVKYMKNRHQEGETHALNIDEILDETNQLDVGSKVKSWLEEEALPNNPKIEMNDEKKFIFKPKYKIQDRKALIKLLKLHDFKGLGGIYLDDIQESLPKSERVLKILESQDEIISIQRPNDKKKILFYNNRRCFLAVDDEFKKMWRSIAVDAMDDDKIEEYLEKQGIKSMQKQSVKKPLLPLKRRKPQRKTVRKIRDNEHLADVLENYDDNAPNPNESTAAVPKKPTPVLRINIH